MTLVSKKALETCCTKACTVERSVLAAPPTILWISDRQSEGYQLFVCDYIPERGQVYKVGRSLAQPRCLNVAVLVQANRLDLLQPGLPLRPYRRWWKHSTQCQRCHRGQCPIRYGRSSSLFLLVLGCLLFLQDCLLSFALRASSMNCKYSAPVSL